MRILAACCVVLVAGLARADAPRVVADIAPVHSLVAQVMQGVDAPGLLIDPGVSPHDHQLRPSQARALEAADLVIWVGPPLTPSLDRALSSLAADATVLTLLDMPGTRVMPFRDTAVFAMDDPHDEEGHHDDDDHDHADHGHTEHDAHDDHEEHDTDDHDHADHKDHEDHHDAHEDGHDHSGDDPHLWLNPDNALIWLGEISDALAEMDPDNAALYRQNATQAQADLRDRIARIDARLAPVRGTPFVVMHDAYQYFETRFDLPAAGAIAASDAATPGPRRIATIQSHLQTEGVRCIFSEPQFDADRVASLAGGSGVRVAQLDPMGAALTIGPGLYGQLLLGLADTLAGCLSDQ